MPINSGTKKIGRFLNTPINPVTIEPMLEMASAVASIVLVTDLGSAIPNTPSNMRIDM
jgi:hypothetical protein